MQNYQLRRVQVLLIIYIELSTAQSNQLNCSFYKADENFYVTQSNGIVIQNDYPKFDQIGYDLFQKSFVMQNFSSGEIKSIISKNSIQYNMELIYCFCQLLEKFSTQIIFCIDGIEIDLQTNQYQKQKYAQITNILLEKKNGHCDQILPADGNQIKAYCQNSTSVILNYINLQDKSLFQIISNEWINEQNCLRKFYSYQYVEYLSYYNCSDWRIYQIDKNEGKFQLILSQEIFNNYFDQQIEFLNDIELCQDYIYLIISNQYLQIQKYSEGFKLHEQKNLTNEILKIFVNDNCKIELIVTQNYRNESIIFNKENNEISIKQNKILDEIFYYKKSLLIKRKNQLKLIFSEFLQQTHTLLENPLISLDWNGSKSTKPIIDSLFYQIDTQSNKVIFYRLLQFKKYLKPSKQYVFQINNFLIFSAPSTIQLDCFQILKEPYYTHQVIQYNKYNILKHNNQCNSIHQFNLSKKLLVDPFYFKLDLVSQQNKEIIDINDDFYINKMCQNFEFNNIEKIIWVNSGKSTLLSFITRDILYFYDCQENKFYYQMNVKDKSIFILNEALIIWQQNQNFINLLQLFDQTTNLIVIPFEYQIQNIISCESYLIIQFFTECIIFNIYFLKQTQLNEELKKYGQPIYYFERNGYVQIIQFHNYLAIKAKNSSLFRIIEFMNKKITKIQETSNFIILYTIHNEENLLQAFIYDGFDLTVTEEFLITESSIYRPLIVSQSLYHTVIATQKNDEISFMLFFTKYQLKRIEIKSIRKLSFYLNNKYLLYFDNQSNLRYKDLNKYQIFLQTTSTQINAFNIYQVQLRFSVNYDNKIEQFIKPYQLLLKNECYQITPKQLQINILFRNYFHILKINQFFYGPISSILTKNPTILIRNPFEIDYQKNIVNCEEQDADFCVFQIENKFEFLDIDCLINRKDNEKIKVELCRARKCFQQFYIKNSQKLVCFIDNNETELEVLILVFIIRQQQVIIDQLISQKFYDNFQDQTKILIIQCELLFIIVNKNFGRNHFFHLSMANLNFEDIKLLNIRQAIPIGNKENYYLILVNEIDSLIKNYTYKFIVGCLKDEMVDNSNYHSLKFINLQQFTFDHESFTVQLLNKGKFHIEYHITINSLLSCEIKEEQLITHLLAQVQGFSLEVQLKYNFQTQLQIFQVEKLIRHPDQNIIFSMQYQNQKILILIDDIHQFYLYDLEQELSMYDYVHKSKITSNLIYEFNTTHYILIDQFNSSFYIEEIGYKIYIQNFIPPNEKNLQNFTLIVENQVSQASILLIVNEDEQIIKTMINKRQVIIVLTFIFLTLFLIFIFLFFQRYKKTNQNNSTGIKNENTTIELY